MSYERSKNEIVSDYSVDLSKDHLATYCRKNYIRNLSETALIDLETGEKWTYKKLEQKRIEISEMLLELGVKQFDKVFIVLGNCLEYAPVVLGVLSVGACAVLANHLSHPRELSEYLKMTECSLVITSPLLSTTIVNILKTTSVKHAIVLKEQGYECLFKHACLKAIDHYNTKYDPSNPQRLEPLGDACKLPAFVLFSSGTTGKPKGVVMTHKGYVSCLCQYKHPSFVSFEDPHHSLLFQPMSHGFGLFRMLYCLSTCTTILVMKRFKLEPFLATIQQYRVAGC